MRPYRKFQVWVKIFNIVMLIAHFAHSPSGSEKGVRKGSPFLIRRFAVSLACKVVNNMLTCEPMNLFESPFNIRVRGIDVYRDPQYIAEMRAVGYVLVKKGDPGFKRPLPKTETGKPRNAAHDEAKACQII
jgi:hypothetical protein